MWLRARENLAEKVLIPTIHVWGVGDTYACVWYHIFSPNNGSPNDGSPNNVSPNNVSPNNVSPNDIFP
jgi:hypothetical protein